MAEITAEWSDADLSSFIPEDITDLVEGVVSPVLEFSQNIAAAAKVVAQGIKLTTAAIPPTTDPILLGLEATLQNLDALLNDLINSGGAVMTVPPQLGGLSAFGNTIRSALLNTRLQERPNISEDGFVAGFGAFAYAPDVLLARTFYNDITGAISADQFLKKKLGVDQLVQTGKFVAHDTKFKLARSASPQPDNKWTGINLGQFIPNSKELIQKISSYLRGTQSQIRKDPLDRFIQVTDRIATNLEMIATDLETTVDFIENAFPELPLKFWRIEPQSGGTVSVAESSKVWFDKTRNPEIAEVANNAFVTGFFVLFGSTTFQSVQDIFDIWDTLILP